MRAHGMNEKKKQYARIYRTNLYIILPESC